MTTESTDIKPAEGNGVKPVETMSITPIDGKNKPSSVPILVYVPGLGRDGPNTVDAIAEAIAGSLDRQDDDLTFDTRTSQGIAAPRGLTAGKTIVDQDATPVVQLFEYDYRPALDASSGPATPAVGPGAIRATTLAVVGVAALVAAWRRPAKTARTKVQLLLGLVTCAALIFAAIVALWALAVAFGANLPWFSGIFGTEEEAGKWSFGIAALGLTFAWAAFRKRLLALAAVAEDVIRFVKNQDVIANSITVGLDDAIDQLRAAGWKGPIHALGYSFGSLVLFEAMFPRSSALLATQPAEHVSSLTTIGCPLDIVRLYAPAFVAGRTARNSGVPWINVFNEADIFASNLKDRDDASPGVGALSPDGVAPTSLKYTDETIGWFQIFMAGRTHTQYWGTRSQASCFDPIAKVLADAPAP